MTRDLCVIMESEEDMRVGRDGEEVKTEMTKWREIKTRERQVGASKSAGSKEWKNRQTKLTLRP